MKVGDTVWTIAAGPTGENLCDPSRGEVVSIDNNLKWIKIDIGGWRREDCLFPTELAAWEAYGKAIIEQSRVLCEQLNTIMETAERVDYRIEELKAEGGTS
jgi:hypothetical protein